MYIGNFAIFHYGISDNSISYIILHVNMLQILTLLPKVNVDQNVLIFSTSPASSNFDVT